MGLLKRPPFPSAIQQEAKTCEDWLARFEQFEHALSTLGIECILIKSVGHLPFESDNTDVFVHPDTLSGASAALEQLGYVQMRNYRRPDKFLFKRLIEGRQDSLIHLHIRVSWGPAFLMEDKLWERRVRQGDRSVITPSAEDSLLLLTAHALYEDDEFKIWDLVRLWQVSRRPGFDWEYVLNHAAHRGWLLGLGVGLLAYDSLARQIWGVPLLPDDIAEQLKGTTGVKWVMQRFVRPGLPLTIPKLVSKFMCFLKIAGDHYDRGAVRFRDAKLLLRLGISSVLGRTERVGHLVAVSGPDGAGKTSVAQVLVDSFKACGIQPVYYWSRIGDSPFLNVLKRLVPSGNGESGGAQRSGMGGFTFAVWASLSLVDLAIRYFFFVRLPRIFGRVVVCDRLLLDSIVDMWSRRPSMQEHDESWVRLLCMVTPLPDTVVFMHVRAETIRERRPGEASSNALESYRRAISRQTTTPLEVSGEDTVLRDEAVRGMLRGYFRRW